MVSDELKILIGFYEKYQSHRTITQQQKMFDLTLINMYKLGNNGRSVISENDLNTLQGISKMDLFNSLKEAEQRGMIKDISTHHGKRWVLSLDGIKYSESLIEQIQK
jgi:DNA-binding Lrp family transcriptional regulator